MADAQAGAPRASAFDPAENDRLLARIGALTPESRGLWGKLDVAGMLAHCRVPIEAAFGDRALRVGLLGRVFGPLVKRVALGDAPFRRGLPTDRQFLPNPGAFEEERAALTAQVHRFTGVEAERLDGARHPFFGPLHRDQWGGLMWKHLDHHLRQFGV